MPHIFRSLISVPFVQRRGKKKKISMAVKCLSMLDYLTLWESNFSEQSYSMLYGNMGTQQYSEN